MVNSASYKAISRHTLNMLIANSVNLILTHLEDIMLSQLALEIYDLLK